jgi:hypothetical protein
MCPSVTCTQVPLGLRDRCAEGLPIPDVTVGPDGTEGLVELASYVITAMKREVGVDATDRVLGGLLK